MYMYGVYTFIHSRSLCVGNSARNHVAAVKLVYRSASIPLYSFLTVFVCMCVFDISVYTLKGGVCMYVSVCLC